MSEPLTHPRILDFIREAKADRLEVLVNTDGYFLSDYVDDLYRAGVDVILREC